MQGNNSLAQPRPESTPLDPVSDSLSTRPPHLHIFLKNKLPLKKLAQTLTWKTLKPFIHATNLDSVVFPAPLTPINNKWPWGLKRFTWHHKTLTKVAHMKPYSTTNKRYETVSKHLLVFSFMAYMLLPWVPEVFSRVRRGASFRRPQADTCSGPKPETAHEKPRAPRVICYRIVSLKLVPTCFGTVCRKSL